MFTSLVKPLFDGPIDIVGDVHGEIGALHSLLTHLGYDPEGDHPQGRRLVFVGDLTDRGPDSPAVVKLVKEFIDQGRAQCVLGNHELNILLSLTKHDNHWFFGRDSPPGGPGPAVLMNTQVERSAVVDFFRSLPVALEREDLRVIHACWDDEMIAVAIAHVGQQAMNNERLGNTLAYFAGRICGILPHFGGWKPPIRYCICIIEPICK